MGIYTGDNSMMHAFDKHVEKLLDLLDQLPKWADDLVDIQNQLHGIKYGGMAKRNARDLEKHIRKAMRIKQ